MTPSQALWGIIFERAWMFSLLAPLIALLIAAHLFRARRRPVTVPSLLPWTELKSSAAPGTRRKRRLSTLLLLQILFACLVITAATGPRFLTEAPHPMRLLVLLDRSAGMKAPSPRGGTRMEAARSALAEEISRIPPSSLILLRCFPPLPEGDIECTAGRIEEHLSSIPPTDAPGTLARALAETAFQGPGVAFEAVLAFSDGTGPPATVPDKIRLHLVGGESANIGIEALSVDPVEGETYRIFLRVRNATPKAVSVPVTPVAGGRPLGNPVTLHLPPGEAKGVTLFPEGIDLSTFETLEVRIRTGDVFPTDDRVFASHGAASRWTVVLGGTDAPYLARFFRSVPDVQLLNFCAGEVSPGVDADLFVFHEKPPSNPPGNAVSVIVSPRKDFWGHSVRPLEGEGRLSCGHRLEEACKGLSRIHFTRLLALDPLPSGAEVRARFRGKAVILGTRPPGKKAFWFVGLPVDPEGSDWPLKPWFPIFWMNLLEVACRSPSSGSGFGFRVTGERIRFPLREGEEGKLFRPDGSEVRGAVSGREISVLAEGTGLYRFQERSGGEEKIMAVNLLAPEETDLTGKDAVMGRLPDLETRPRAERAYPLGGGLAALALALLLLFLLLEIPGKWKRIGLVLVLLVCGGVSCGSSSEKPGDKPSGLAPGLPLPSNPEKKREIEATRCKKCGRLSGPGHACGLSAWCSRCGRESSLKDHVCGLSFFCPRCGREAALTGHRCGETKFCPLCKMEVPIAHRHEGGAPVSWGDIR